MRGYWFVAVLLLLLGIPAGWNLSSWPSRLHYQGALGDDVDGICLAEMLNLRRGVPVYAPPTPERFDAMVYGPVYYWLGAKLIDPENPTYRPLRIMSLLATLACLAGVSVLAFRFQRSYLAATLAPLLFLCYGFVSWRALSARCDMMALALLFWGFIIARKYCRTRALLLAVPFIVLGLFFKQQYVAAPLAICLYLVLERRWRLAVTFAGLTILSGTALLAYFQFVVYPGQSLLLHLIDYNMMPFSLYRFGWGLVLFVVMFGVPILLSLTFLRRHPDRLMGPYLGCAATGAVVVIGREGSGTNYYLEPLLIICALVAALAAESRIEAGQKAEVICLLGVSLFLGTRLLSFAPSPPDFVLDRRIHDYLRAHVKKGTPAAGMNVATGELVRAGFETPISNFYQYTWLACRGAIPLPELLAHFDRQRFSVVALDLNLEDEQQAHRRNDICLTEDLHRVILLNYRLAATLDLPGHQQIEFPARLYLWVPRSGAARQSGRLAH